MANLVLILDAQWPPKAMVGMLTLMRVVNDSMQTAVEDASRSLESLRNLSEALNQAILQCQLDSSTIDYRGASRIICRSIDAHYARERQARRDREMVGNFETPAARERSRSRDRPSGPGA